MSTLHSKSSIETSIMLLVDSWASNRSKDPSTKVGAGIYDPENGGLFLGYNGFPKGWPDSKEYWETDTKYSLVIHAEVNAVSKALRSGVDIGNCWLVCTHLPCRVCMKDVIAMHRPQRVIYSSDQYRSCADVDRVFAKTVCDFYNISLEKLP